MDQVLETLAARSATFNGVLEAGLRSVTLLASAFPRKYDLQRLVTLDYLLVHTEDIGGPDSLHPSAPLHSSALLVRRPLVEQGLLLMMTRHLVEREVGLGGIEYRAGENAVTFLTALESPYMRALNERANWLNTRVGQLNDAQLQSAVRRIFGNWVHEFNDADRPEG